MKKKMLLTTAALLATACIVGPSLSANAATLPQKNIFRFGNGIIISYGGNCNGNSLFEELLQCLPPQSPESPDNNRPEVETPDVENMSFIGQVVSLVNIERAKEGLAALTVDEKVQAAAQIRAMECEQSFSHTRPNGSNFATALKEQGVSYRRAGENIAWGQRSPEEVVNAWMNSPGHRANIMNANFTKIGVGYYQNANGTNYWSQLFIN